MPPLLQLPITSPRSSCSLHPEQRCCVVPVALGAMSGCTCAFGGLHSAIMASVTGEFLLLSSHPGKSTVCGPGTNLLGPAHLGGLPWAAGGRSQGGTDPQFSTVASSRAFISVSVGTTSYFFLTESSLVWRESELQRCLQRACLPACCNHGQKVRPTEEVAEGKTLKAFCRGTVEGGTFHGLVR